MEGTGPPGLLADRCFSPKRPARLSVPCIGTTVACGRGARKRAPPERRCATALTLSSGHDVTVQRTYFPSSVIVPLRSRGSLR
jgi:hypothetical protein